MMTQERDPKSYLQAAHNIGKYLAKEAIWIDDKCNWTGHEVTVVDGKHVNIVTSCGIEFYSGLSGVALFLSELYFITKDSIILHTLDGTLNTIFSNFDSKPLNNYGYYSGKIGLGCALYRIGKKLDREELVSKGLEIVVSVKEEPISDHEIDVISGAAGAIPPLLKLYHHENNPTFLDMAIKCGDFLLDKATVQSDAFSWKTVDPNYGLTGYSHGASGMASALLDLYAVTKDEKYWHASMGGFRYEQSWFNQQKQNWPDLRRYSGQGTPTCGMMWCHGAPGISIALMKAYELTKDDFFLNTAKIALATTLRGVVNDLQPNAFANFSLCHGLAGNSDILLVASDLFNEPEYRNVALRAGDLGIRLYDQTRTVYPSGVNDPTNQTLGRQENVGLMLGLSGTGMFYLRLHDSKSIPSALIP
jgi:lantibiotic modifying enzyme